tara:strand:+ start:522 stop:1136 length:615 start_codon:yes stop_codon:yes gene_type:complete
MFSQIDFSGEIGSCICAVGPMFASKSSWVIGQASKELIVGSGVMVFKHDSDTRYSDKQEIFTHDGRTFDCYCVSDAQQIREIFLGSVSLDETGEGGVHTKPSAVIIDECQFFSEKLVDIVQELVNEHNVRVYVAGLDMDFRGQPWETTAKIMAISDEVHKLRAICGICQKRYATHSKRICESQEVLLLGAKEGYVAACRNCHNT